MAKVEILQQKGYNFLWINNYLWMWDIPVEQRAQKEIADQAFGNVLVAGYGLGIVQRYLFRNPKVRSISTIEKIKEIPEKTKKTYGRIYGKIMVGDFFDTHGVKKFDCVIGDIWQDIIPEALNDYKKFKQKARQFLKSNGKILTWCKDFFEYMIEKEKNSKTK